MKIMGHPHDGGDRKHFTNNVIANRLGVTPSTASYHLNNLRSLDLVERSRYGWTLTLADQFDDLKLDLQMMSASFKVKPKGNDLIFTIISKRIPDVPPREREDGVVVSGKRKEETIRTYADALLEHVPEILHEGRKK